MGRREVEGGREGRELERERNGEREKEGGMEGGGRQREEDSEGGRGGQQAGREGRGTGREGGGGGEGEREGVHQSALDKVIMTFLAGLSPCSWWNGIT